MPVLGKKSKIFSEKFNKANACSTFKVLNFAMSEQKYKILLKANINGKKFSCTQIV